MKAFARINAPVAVMDAKAFEFTLCHEGVNLNGDYFPREELEKAAQTIIGKRVDVEHKKGVFDVIGDVTSAEFIVDPIRQEARVDCVGRLITDASEEARHIWGLMKIGQIRHCSMECEYDRGECSICGKTYASLTERCLHLKFYKGRFFEDEAVYDILHGVRFDGVGVLNKPGADPDATILKVAAHEESSLSELLCVARNERVKYHHAPVERDSEPEPETLGEELVRMLRNRRCGY